MTTNTGRLAALAITLAAGAAHAMPVTYDLDGRFGFSASTSNLNGGANFTGGTLKGFLTFDDAGVLTDYQLDTVQPGRFANPLRSESYDPTTGDPLADGYTGTIRSGGPGSFVQGTSGATFYAVNFGFAFGGRTPSSINRLILEFDPDDIGEGMIEITGGTENVGGNCNPSFPIFGFRNGCFYTQNGQFDLSLTAERRDAGGGPGGGGVSPVPLPAGGVLLIAGLATMGAVRRRRG